MEGFSCNLHPVWGYKVYKTFSIQVEPKICNRKVDEVLLLEDGSYAPLDYKFAEWKERLYDTYRQQLICYAVLIEDNFGGEVKKGFLVYIRSSNKLIEVDINEKAKEEIKESMAAMAEIISKNFFPKATKFKQRCLNCTYRNICIQ